MPPFTRIFAALLTCALASADAAAQFRRGILADSVEITLFPSVPPALLLPSGSFRVDAKNQSTGPVRLLSRLDEAITTQMAENDSRLQVVEGGADMQVVVTLTEWTLSRRRGSRYVSETRQVGTKQVTDKNGKQRTEPIYEYGRNKPTVIDDGAAAVRMEVRRGALVLADETARVTYHEDRLAEEGSRPTSEVDEALLDRAAQRAAGLVTPAREGVRVLLARSDEVDKLNDLARSRKWNEWRAALQETRPHRDAKRDAYRLHNLGVAHEALAYEASSDEDTQRLITEAASFLQQAVNARRDEKYFVEAFNRVSTNRLGFTRLRSMRESLGLRQASTVAPAAATVPSSADTRPAAAPTDASAMTNADVLDLRKAGLDDDNLIAAIRDAGTVSFDLSPTGLKALLSGKVSNRVITAMRERR